MKYFLFLLMTFVCWSCTQSSEFDKYQKKRNNRTNVQNRITKVDMEEMPVSDFATPYILNDYLIVSDYKSLGKLIHIFDKNSFSYIASIGDRGLGPNEIANMGDIAINESAHRFYVLDQGKNEVCIFNIDSILANKSSIPEEKIKMNASMPPRRYEYINDSLSIGLFIQGVGNSDYMPIVARWNMNTGYISPMEYVKHPEIEKKRVSLAVSKKNNIYVECYWYHDLITICDLNGNLKYNIYGKKWDNKKSNVNGYYDNVIFCKDKIVASYLGSERIVSGKNGEQVFVYPDTFVVFDKNGDYIQTLEVKCGIISFCYDEDNNRIVMTLDNDILFAYLDLDGIV